MLLFSFHVSAFNPYIVYGDRGTLKNSLRCGGFSVINEKIHFPIVDFHKLPVTVSCHLQSMNQHMPKAHVNFQEWRLPSKLIF